MNEQTPNENLSTPILQFLTRETPGDVADADLVRNIEKLAHAPRAAITLLLNELGKIAPQLLASRVESKERTLEAIFRTIAGRRDVTTCVADSALESLEAIDAALPADGLTRRSFLTMLAKSRSNAALDLLARSLAARSIGAANAVDHVLAPLFRLDRAGAAVLFPTLLDTLSQPHAAPAVLDLANYYFDEGVLESHPAADRGPRFAALLGQIVQNLRHIEDRAQAGEFPPDAAQRNALREEVNQGVALAVSLCHTLGQLGEPAAIPKLNQALEVQHRRVHLEAAWALAKLGDKMGIDALVARTSDPVSRSRALSYLEELNLLDKVPEENRTPLARAEGEFVNWLASPTNFGIPPQRLNLLDHTRQYWPSFDDRVDCFLFEYEYDLPQGTFRGIGMGGPVTHSFRGDLNDLEPADLYAMYAGWQAEHPEIHETPVDRLSPHELSSLNRDAERLSRAGFQEVRWVLVGEFFGDLMRVATASKDSQRGTVVLDDAEIHWYPSANPSLPRDPALVYSLHKGRRLMQIFNPPSQEEDET